ncbi:MAG: WD40 repeat domain-containing protein [Prosthecobacter sp.]|uniref:WD40 repeat domain-containing protein n=1 Tax=Prosthecobacter sp. TaxID=1965333 RepID=UPI003902BC66
MKSKSIWQKLIKIFRLAPVGWSISDGDKTEGSYVHSTSILDLSWAEDDSYLALAGGGCLPGADGSIRIIDPLSKRNIKTLNAHVCGVHALSIDPATGILASASFDYAAHLWDLDEDDIIFLRGEDGKCKGYCEFSPQGSLLAIGEYDYYEGSHSFYIYSLSRQKNVFEHALPLGMGVTAMGISLDGNYLAVAARDQNEQQSTHLYLVQISSLEVVKEHVLSEDIGFYDLAFTGKGMEIVGLCNGGEAETVLHRMDAHTGALLGTLPVGGIGGSISISPGGVELAVGSENRNITVYSTVSWSILRTYPACPEESGRLCSLAYSRDGKRLAYGLSSGIFDILPNHAT